MTTGSAKWDKLPPICMYFRPQRDSIARYESPVANLRARDSVIMTAPPPTPLPLLTDGAENQLKFLNLCGFLRSEQLNLSTVGPGNSEQIAQ
jgi:hypothetical protein